MMPLLDTLVARLGALPRGEQATSAPAPGFPALLMAGTPPPPEAHGAGADPTSDIPPADDVSAESALDPTVGLGAPVGAAPIPLVPIPLVSVERVRRELASPPTPSPEETLRAAQPGALTSAPEPLPGGPPDGLTPAAAGPPRGPSEERPAREPDALAPTARHSDTAPGSQSPTPQPLGERTDDVVDAPLEAADQRPALARPPSDLRRRVSSGLEDRGSSLRDVPAAPSPTATTTAPSSRPSMLAAEPRTVSTFSTPESSFPTSVGQSAETADATPPPAPQATRSDTRPTAPAPLVVPAEAEPALDPTATGPRPSDAPAASAPDSVGQREATPPPQAVPPIETSQPREAVQPPKAIQPQEVHSPEAARRSEDAPPTEAAPAPEAPRPDVDAEIDLTRPAPARPTTGASRTSVPLTGDPDVGDSQPSVRASGDPSSEAPEPPADVRPEQRVDRPVPTAAPSISPTAAVAVSVAAAEAVAQGAGDEPPPDGSEAVGLDATEGAPSLARAPEATGPGRAEAPMPARLAAPAWLNALATAGNRRSVRVDLADGGSVRLRTEQEGDAVNVRVQFSDPELQALAGAHAGRLRDLLEAHFAEPVRLHLADGQAQAGGPGADGSPGHDDRPGTGRPAGRSAPRAASDAVAPSTPDARPAAGRREWIG